MYDKCINTSTEALLAHYGQSRKFQFISSHSRRNSDAAVDFSLANNTIESINDIVGATLTVTSTTATAADIANDDLSNSTSYSISRLESERHALQLIDSTLNNTSNNHYRTNTSNDIADNHEFGDNSSQTTYRYSDYPQSLTTRSKRHSTHHFINTSANANNSTSMNSYKVQEHVDPRWGGRYAHAYSKLYILINNISSNSLSSQLTHHCLAKLAACSAIAVIATIEHLNSPIVWDSTMLCNYNWNCMHFPTYILRDIPSASPFIANNRSFTAKSELSANARTSKAIEFVLKSLTSRHHEVLTFVCDHVIKRAIAKTNKSSNTSSTCNNTNRIIKNTDKNITIKELLAITSTHMGSAATLQELKALLKEFVDHKVFSVNTDASNNDVIHLLFDQAEIEKFATVKW